MKKFFQEVREEFGKVVWPTRTETINSTILVVALSVAVGLYLGLFDVICTQLLNNLTK